MRRASLLILALLALGAMFAGPAAAATRAPKPTLQLLKTHRYGSILIAGDGYMIYGFSTDTPRHDSCLKIRQCLSVWPPVLAPHKLVLGRGVRRSLVHSIRLRNGKQQLTYNGWPLYLYVGDTSPRETDNINILQFGGFWPAVNAAGRFVPAS